MFDLSLTLSRLDPRPTVQYHWRLRDPQWLLMLHHGRTNGERPHRDQRQVPPRPHHYRVQVSLKGCKTHDSGSAFPATLALQIRQLEPQGFKLDGVVTVIDCVNFEGYEDTSPTAKLQAQYTDLHLLSKWELVTERQLDLLLDKLGDLTDSTPHIKVSKESPLRPDLVFGLDSKLFEKGSEEANSWKALGGEGEHMEEVETKSVWRGGGRPGKHEKCGDKCKFSTGPSPPVPLTELKAALSLLANASEIYRGECEELHKLKGQTDSQSRALYACLCIHMEGNMCRMSLTGRLGDTS